MKGCLVLVVGMPAASVVRAVTVWLLWAWFIAPLGIRSLGFAESYFVGLAVHYVSHGVRYTPSTKDDEKQLVARFVGSQILSPLFVLAVGAIGRFWVLR